MNLEQVALLRKHVDWVQEQAQLPEIDREWSQAHWKADQTTHARRLMEGTGEYWNEYLLHYRQLEPHCKTAFCLAGNVVHEEVGEAIWQMRDLDICIIATNLIGLTGIQAEVLFCATNTAEEIRHWAERFVEQNTGLKLY